MSNFSASNQNKAILTVNLGQTKGRTFEVGEGEHVVGRSDPDAKLFPAIDLDQEDVDAKVSRRHAALIIKHGRAFLEDLGSLNGTFVTRIGTSPLEKSHRVELMTGDELVFGNVSLILTLG